jgi:hypothetical protein
MRSTQSCSAGNTASAVESQGADLAGTDLTHQQHQAVIQAFGCLEGSFYFVVNRLGHGRSVVVGRQD